MSIEAAVRERLRICLARQLEAASGMGLPGHVLLEGARLEGYRVTTAEIEAEVDYLIDKGLLAKVEKLISPEIKRWRISAAGRDWLAEMGF